MVFLISCCFEYAINWPPSAPPFAVNRTPQEMQASPALISGVGIR